MNYHALSVTQALSELNSQAGGLSAAEVARRLEKYGANKLLENKAAPWWKIFLDQFTSFLVLLLFLAAFLALAIGETVDAVVIFLILIVNAAVGFFQEYKAESALAALKNLEALQAKVWRSGQEELLEARLLVPGDIVSLQEGDRIVADGRVIDSLEAQSDESVLTGESKPVTKTASKVGEKAALAERSSMLYSGSLLLRGKATMLVTATGMNSEFGRIAGLVQVTERSRTPLQVTLAKLSQFLGLLSLSVAAPILIIGVIMGRDLGQTLILTVALAVSAIPEGLPVVVTVVLALGVKRMVSKQVLVRKLNAVEALGSVNVICTDKTGTLTENRMTVKESFLLSEKNANELAVAALLCNDASEHVGDPTEKALYAWALKTGLKASDRENNPRLDELPFSSKNKYMLTLHQRGTSKIVYAKGAPEKILTFCDLSKTEEELINQQIKTLTAKGARILALASKKTDSLKKLEHYQFLGLLALADPARATVKQALADCKTAGIRVIMITGDHPLTAKAIAQEVGIETERIITGVDLDAFSADELKLAIDNVNVFARVSPEHKILILKQLQAAGNFVAMTGDGVNDAPALKEANIGVALGDGTDLAKQVSEMVILDNDFASIVEAVREGRGIFFNIKKVIVFLLSLNFDEILLILSSLIFSFPLPLLPIHILWLNLASDSLPALALSVDPYQKDLMSKKPYQPQQEIMRGVWGFSLTAGILGFLACLTVFMFDYYVFANALLHAQTMVLTTMVLFELFFVFVVRSQKRLKYSRPWANKWLLLAVLAGLLFQLLVIYLPDAQFFFKTVPLTMTDWSLLLPFSLVGVLGFELLHMLGFRFYEKEG